MDFAENQITSDEGELAKTIMPYMLGVWKIEWCETMSTNNVNLLELAKMKKVVINFVQDCGFEVICIITDNHSINRTMFKSFTENGL